MPAVRARLDTASTVPVKVVELDSLDMHTLGPRSDDTDRAGCIKGFFSVGSSANYQTTNHLSVSAACDVASDRVLHTGEQVVSCLEIMPLHSTNTLSDGTVSLVLVGD